MITQVRFSSWSLPYRRQAGARTGGLYLTYNRKDQQLIALF